MSRCEDFPSVSFKPLRKPFKSYFKSFAHIADTLNEKHIIEPLDLHCSVLWRIVYIWCTRMLYWNALKDWRADPESTSIKSVCSAWLSAAHLTYLLNSQIEFELGPFKVHERVHCNSPGFGIRVVSPSLFLWAKFPRSLQCHRHGLLRRSTSDDQLSSTASVKCLEIPVSQRFPEQVFLGPDTACEQQDHD